MKIQSCGHTFEVVEEVPLGYEIWNIGKNMIDGYLPLCRLSSQQAFPGGRSIEAERKQFSRQSDMGRTQYKKWKAT